MLTTNHVFKHTVYIYICIQYLPPPFQGLAFQIGILCVKLIEELYFQSQCLCQRRNYKKKKKISRKDLPLKKPKKN